MRCRGAAPRGQSAPDSLEAPMSADNLAPRLLPRNLGSELTSAITNAVLWAPTLFSKSLDLLRRSASARLNPQIPRSSTSRRV
jgi:hypothetical protein